MQIDLETAPEQGTFESHVCIVGAGIAGLLLARHLGSHGIDTHLLEAGGRDLEPRSQEIYAVQMDGTYYAGATEGRFRAFGGSSTRWGGQLLAYTPDIFRPIAGTPSAAWPITAADLQPYYAEAQRVVYVPHQSSDEELLQCLGLTEHLGANEINVRFSRWIPFSKRNLAKTVGMECLHSRRVTVFMHANVTSIELSKTGGHVESVVAKNYAGKTYTFRARHFVLCTGTIESSRLLLASRTVRPDGIGNETHNVGRYFHDHVSVAAAAVEGVAKRKFAKLFAPRLVSGILHTPKLEAAVPLRRKKNLLAVMAHFAIEEPEGSGIAGIRNLLQGIQRDQNLEQLGRTILALPASSGEIARLLWSAHVHKRRAISSRATVTLRIDCEQLPKPENRIRLSAARDKLGMPQAIVDWRISEDEHRTVRVFAEIVDSFLSRLGICPLAWRPEIWEPGNSWLHLTRDTYHPIGGTRMGTDPHASVVEPNLKVHGVPNLFVASCSVFPSGGSSNPTLTLMALTLRLGAHLAALCSPPWTSLLSGSTKAVLPDSQVPAELSVD